MSRRTVVGPLLVAAARGRGLFVVSGGPGSGSPAASTGAGRDRPGAGATAAVRLGRTPSRRGRSTRPWATDARPRTGRRPRAAPTPTPGLPAGAESARRLRQAPPEGARPLRAPRTGCPGRASRSPGRTVGRGPARPATPTSRRGRPVTADTIFAIASMSKTFTSALILGLVDDGKLGLDTKVATLLPEGPAREPRHADPGRRHRPDAARPHERPGRLLLREGDRQGPHGRSRRDLDGRTGPGLRRQAARQAGPIVALLEHELPAARAASPSGSAARRSPSSSASACSIRLGLEHAYIQVRREADAVRSRSATTTTSRACRARPIGLADAAPDDRAVHLGRDRGRLGRQRRRDLGRPGGLGTRPLRRQGPAPGDARPGRRRREADGRLPSVRAVRARRPGDRGSTVSARTVTAAGSSASAASCATCPGPAWRSPSSRTRTGSTSDR